MFRFELHTRDGVLHSASTVDFLLAVLMAKQAKDRFLAALPHSRLRVRFFYANGRRADKSDLKAALIALQNDKFCAQVAGRMAADVRGAERTKEHRTAAQSAARFSGFLGSVFSQAGVVAPPDSPDLGNSPISATSVSSV